MKKLLTLFVAASLAGTLSAQSLSESKSIDNWYVGVNGGLSTQSTGHGWLKGLNPNAGVRVGRYFTPVFGLAVESNAYLKNTDGRSTGTFVNALNTSLLGTVNVSNWFGGYPGSPRSFEVVALYGLGWGHVFGSPSSLYSSVQDAVTSKAGLDFVFNLGRSKSCQFYVEPAMVWSLGGNDFNPGVQYNLNHSAFQLNVGLIYKLKNSNGTHNFQISEVRDPYEIDALNSRINDLRLAVIERDATIASQDCQLRDLRTALDDCIGKSSVATYTTVLQPTVQFRQGKSSIESSQYASIERIAQYMRSNPDVKVEIVGYASPEGSADFNQRLSEKRADVVKKTLVNKYHISSDRLISKGKGATDKLFEQVEFNRVAVFNSNF